MTTASKAISVEDVCYGLFVDLELNLYCSLYDQHKVMMKSLIIMDESWIIAAGLGCSGVTSNQLNKPLGIFVDTSFNLYVADSGNNRIQLFSANRAEGTTMPITGPSGDWTLNTPSGVILDGDGYLFISDSSNHRILGSGPNGFRCIIGCRSTGSASNELNIPRAISFDSYGNLFVVDQGNNRIQKFNLIPNTSVRKYSFETNSK